VLKGRTVVVQEYGVPSPELLAGLAERGAEVFPVHTYDWVLPEDTTPLRNAVKALIRSEVQVVLVRAAVQAQHLFQIAGEMDLQDDLIHALSGVIVCSDCRQNCVFTEVSNMSMQLIPQQPLGNNKIQ
jgi:uroporphyrinogen-III synthase